MGASDRAVIVPGVAATPGTIVFQSAPNGSGTERPAIFACPATGCVGVPVQFTGDGLNGYKAQVPTRYGTRVGWNSGGGGIGSADCTAGVCNAPINPGNKAKAYTLNDTHIFYVENLSPNASIKKCKHGIQPCTNELVSAGAYETVVGDSNYDPTADLTGDEAVNLDDFLVLAGSYELVGAE